MHTTVDESVVTSKWDKARRYRPNPTGNGDCCCPSARLRLGYIRLEEEEAVVAGLGLRLSTRAHKHISCTALMSTLIVFSRFRYQDIEEVVARSSSVGGDVSGGDAEEPNRDRKRRRRTCYHGGDHGEGEESGERELCQRRATARKMDGFPKGTAVLLADRGILRSAPARHGEGEKDEDGTAAETAALEGRIPKKGSSQRRMKLP
ncbi:hypothetical protein B296_00053723 [Ensete ventricosum]|uniref:Uncharacterized protein n=1 Tax=Ensete ventricosum TaxID=4639 RepID=A0A426X629_ENSVE|nr:hypothetical protein B296_00053723 [Ensete ventricosum]